MSTHEKTEEVAARAEFPHAQLDGDLSPVKEFLIHGRWASLYQRTSNEPLVAAKPDSYALFWNDEREPLESGMSAERAFARLARLLEEGTGTREISCHDLVQVRPDAPSSYRGCFGIVTGADEGNPREYLKLEFILPAQGLGVPRVIRQIVFERCELRRLGPAPFLPGADPFPTPGAGEKDVTWVVNVPD